MVLRVSLKVSLDYELLASEVAYIELASSVRLDTTGLFRFIPDTVVTTDGTVFALSKPLSVSFSALDATFLTALKLLQDGFAMNDGADAVDGSTYSFSKGIQNVTFVADSTTQSALKALADGFDQLDLLVKFLSRPVSDSFPMTDSIQSIDALKSLANALVMADTQTVSTIKALADSIAQPDATAIDLAKLLDDSVPAIELISKLLSRPVSDLFLMSDSIQSVDALKGIPDSITMQDSLQTLLLFIRDFDDQVSVSDLRATLFIPSTKVEQITVADNDVIGYQKNIADGFAMNDGSEAIDGSQYSIHKGISNVAFVGDLRVTLFSTSRLESVSTPDAGLVLAQSYADPTYFAEDYVGVSQSF
jgi:hypothetical protein